MAATDPKYDDLTLEQRRLFDEVEQDATGADLRDVLRAATGSAKDKAAVAEILGGIGAGREFLES